MTLIGAVKNLVLILIACLAVMSYACDSVAEYINLPKDASGWTMFTPSADTRIMYVSTEGNDSSGQVYSSTSPEVGEDPFKPSGAIQPFATYGAAYAKVRSGYPDWVLIKRGDIFYDAIGSRVWNGRSVSEPALISSYGTEGAAPIFKVGAQQGIRIAVVSPSTPSTRQFIAISGLAFYAHTRDPGNSGEYVSGSGGLGVEMWAYIPGNRVTGVLVEGCSFSFMIGNTIGGAGGGGANYITIRRTLFLNNYSDSTSSQGLWGENQDNVILEENIFDHNGWYSVSGSGDKGQGTILNHNTYFAGAKNTTIRNNIFMRGSNMNNKFTSPTGDSANIVIEGNLYVGGHIGIGIGTNYLQIPDRFDNIFIKDNVFTNLGMDNVTGQGIAWYMQISGWRSGIVSNNLLMNQHGQLPGYGTAYGFEVWNDANCLISNNTIYRIEDSDGVILLSAGIGSKYTFSGNTIQNPYGSPLIVSTSSNFSEKKFSNNKYFSSSLENSGFYFDSANRSFQSWQAASGDNSTFEQVSFPDPTRSIETYMQHIGETSTIDNFIEKCREQDRYNWDERFTASRVNNYIKAGFGYLNRLPIKIQTGTP